VGGKIEAGLPVQRVVRGCLKYVFTMNVTGVPHPPRMCKGCAETLKHLSKYGSVIAVTSMVNVAFGL